MLTEPGEQAVTELRRRLDTLLDDYLQDWPADQADAFAHALGRFAGEALAAPAESNQ